METRTTTVRTSDGHDLLVLTGGDALGRAVLVHGGTPNSRLLADAWLEDAERRNIRLISYDRPGYGGSSARPGRSIADCASDVRAIADALSIERMAIWGYSGGGPHALACAALLPDLVSAVATLASVAPHNAPGLDWYEGMGKDNAEGFMRLVEDPEAARLKIGEERLEALLVTPETIFEGWASLVSGADAAVLTGALASFLVDSLKVGLAPGELGWWDDCVAEMSPWGFDLGAVAVPVQLWHGAEDRFVPVQHGRWLSEQIPGVEAHLTEEDGHLTLLANRVPEVHDWLLQHA